MPWLIVFVNIHFSPCMRDTSRIFKSLLTSVIESAASWFIFILHNTFILLL